LSLDTPRANARPLQETGWSFLTSATTMSAVCSPLMFLVLRCRWLSVVLPASYLIDVEVNWGRPRGLVTVSSVESTVVLISMVYFLLLTRIGTKSRTFVRTAAECDNVSIQSADQSASINSFWNFTSSWSSL
jgi:hypothetical protein